MARLVDSGLGLIRPRARRVVSISDSGFTSVRLLRHVAVTSVSRHHTAKTPQGLVTQGTHLIGRATTLAGHCAVILPVQVPCRDKVAVASRKGLKCSQDTLELLAGDQFAGGRAVRRLQPLFGRLRGCHPLASPTPIKCQVGGRANRIGERVPHVCDPVAPCQLEERFLHQVLGHVLA